MATLGSGNDNPNIDGGVTSFVDFGGNDTYTILPSLSADVSITDNQASTINLPEGIEISAANFSANGVQFTVNGFTVTLIGNPSLFTFVFGGTPLNVNAGTPKTFAETAVAFGTTVPAEGDPINAATQTGTVSAAGTVGQTLGLTASANSVDEGASVDVSLTDGMANTDYAYTITGVDAADIDLPLTGTFTTDANGAFTGTINAIADLTTEGAETMSIAIDGTNLSTDVVINDTSVTPPLFTLAEAKDQVNEGEANTFTVTLTEAATEDTTVTFQLNAGDGAAADQSSNTTNLNDFGAGAFNPVTATIKAGDTTATFDVTALGDALTELAETYSVTATVNGQSLTETSTVLDGPGDNVAQTVLLTTGVDQGPAFATGGADDTFIGGLINNTQTLSAGDVLDGGAGTDTLNATITGGTTGFRTSNIEIFNVNNAGGVSTVDVNTSTGYQQIWSDGSIGALTVNNIGDDAVLGLRSTSQAFTAGFDAGALADKAVDVALMNAGVAPTTANATANNTSGAAALTTTGDSSATSVNVSSMGSANRLNIADIAGSSVTDVNISGDAADTYVAVSGDAGSVQNITSTATGNVVILAGGDTAGTQTGDIRNVSTLGGNDRYVTNASGFDENDKVNLGEGTDELELHFGGAIGLTSSSANVKGANAAMGVETLILDVWEANGGGGVETVSFKASDFTAINSFVINDTWTDNAAAAVGSNVQDADIAGAVTVTGVEDADMFSIKTETQDNLSFTKDVGSTATKLNLTLVDDIDDGVGDNGGKSITTNLTDVNLAVSFKSDAAAATLDAQFDADLKLTSDNAKVTMTGSTNALMDVLLTGTGKSSTLDISGVSGAVDGNLIDGGDGGSTIVATSKKDTITGGTGNDNITAGDGDDTINVETGDDTVDAGAGNDTVNVTSLNASDALDGGEGTDTLGISQAVVAANLVNVKNFEALKLNVAVNPLDVVQVDANNKIAAAEINNNGTNVLNNVSGDFATLTLGTAGSGATVTVDRLIDTTSNALAFSAASANANATDNVTANLTIADEETLTITQGKLENQDNLAVTIADGDDLTSITASGAQASTSITATNAALNPTTGSATRTVTVDGSGLTSTAATAFNADFGGADNVAVNVTGATVGGNILTGGDNNDTLTGGLVNDTLTGGLGADVINGGTGTDLFQAGVTIGGGEADGGVGAINGMVINLSDAAINSATVLANGGGTTSLAGLGTAVASNTTAYLFAAPAVTGSDNRDTLSSIENATGTNGADQIYGSSGANVLNGLANNDFIDGGAGNDVITGGAGADTLTGGTGADDFVFSGLTAATNGQDAILDFSVAQGDQFDLPATLTTLANANVGTAITTATAAALATEGTSIAVGDNEYYVINQVANEADIDSVADIITALADGGVLDAVDIAQGAGNVAGLIITAVDDPLTTYIYGFTDDANAAAVEAAEIALIGVVTNDASRLEAGTPFTTDSFI